MRAATVRAVGIGWFRKEDYARCRGIMSDAHVLPARYEDWLQRAENIERQLVAEGAIVYRAVIDPENFPAWCTVRGLNVDAKGRVAFGSWYAMERVKHTH